MPCISECARYRETETETALGNSPAWQGSMITNNQSVWWASSEKEVGAAEISDLAA